jgi:HAD superfamily hydrolase (TIGR01549 family)
MLLTKSIKAIFYDLDGTLRFNNPSSRDLFIDEAIRQGIAITAEDRLRATRWEHYYFGGSAEVYADSEAFPERKSFWVNYSRRQLTALGASNDQVEKLGLLLHEYMNEHNHPNDMLMPGVLQTLKALKETGLILAVVSNRDEPYHEYLQELGLAEYFDFSLAAGEVQSWKPDKAIFEHALRMGGVQADETIYIGDNYYADVLGARNAGIQPILIDAAGIFEAPGCPVVCSHQELLDLLQKGDDAWAETTSQGL